MKRFAYLMAGALVFAAAFASMDEATARKEMKAMEKRAIKAFKNEDAKTLVDMLAEDFTWTHQGGRPTENKKQAADGLKQFFAMGDHFNVKWTTDSFTYKDGKVVMVTSSVMSCKMKLPKDKKTHTMKSTGSVRETWVKGPKGWKATMFEDQPGEKMTMDGKPYDPSKMGGPGGGGGK